MSRATTLPQQGQVCVTFMNKLKELRQDRDLCDIVLELRNEKFEAHKVVLAAWSPALYSVLTPDCQRSRAVLRLQYDNTHVFASFLAFLYSGQMDDVAQENMIQILHLATSLQVQELRQVCEDWLKRQVHIANIISTYHVARKFRLPNLEEYALNYMQMNLPEAVKQADFLSLSPPRFNSFLSSGWVCVMKPEVKLFLIISWLGYDVKERQQYLVLLLRYIDWSAVANDFLNEISQTENFFTTNESSLYLLLQTLFSSHIHLGPYADTFAALRDKYAYLLDHIIQNSYVLPFESEEYFPVLFHLVGSSAADEEEELEEGSVSRFGGSVAETAAPRGRGEGDGSQRFQQRALLGNGGSSSSGTTTGGGYTNNPPADSSDHPFSHHDLSNDSVTAGIGMGMRKVSIVETHAVFGSSAKTLTPEASAQSSGKTCRKQGGAAAGGVFRDVDGKSSSSSPTQESRQQPSEPLRVSARAKKGARKKEKKESAALKKKKEKELTNGEEKSKCDNNDSKLASPQTRKQRAEKPDNEAPSPVKILRSILAQEASATPKTRPAKNPSLANKPKPQQEKDGGRQSASEKPHPVKQEPSEATASGSAVRPSGRPKRLAATKFNVLESLKPQRRTKAALKQRVIPTTTAATTTTGAQENTALEGARQKSDANNSNCSRPSIGDNDVNSDVDDTASVAGEDSDRDPDYHLPKKESQPSSAAAKALARIAKPRVKKEKTSKSKAKGPHGKRKGVAVKGKGGKPSKKMAAGGKKKDGGGGRSQSLLRGILAVAGSQAALATAKEEPVEEKPKKSEDVDTPAVKREDDDDDDDDGGDDGMRVFRMKRQCKDCEYSAPTQRRLANHMERVHGSRATLFVCCICQFECKWNKKFYDHMKLHFEGPPYTCDFLGCDWQAERIHVLLIHRRRHTDDRPHKCPHCATRFKTRNNLIAHLKCHSEARDHVCPMCQRCFRMKNTLEQHMVTHSDLRPYLCDTCGFSTKFQSHLISHKRIHTGEVFQCGFPMCTYSSPKRSQLKAHMRSHLNIRHHSCQVCHKAFVEKSHLVRHLKIHQDVRPYRCDQCEYSSTRVDKVNEHRRKYHSQEAGAKKHKYRYIARSKKGQGKRFLYPPPPPPTTPPPLANTTTFITPEVPHPPGPGRPIRPKKGKTSSSSSSSPSSSSSTLALPLPEALSLATLASAAEVMDLRNPFPVAFSRRVRSYKKSQAGKSSAAMMTTGTTTTTSTTSTTTTTTAQGEVSSFETEGSRDMIQVDVVYGVGHAPVKKESGDTGSSNANPSSSSCASVEEGSGVTAQDRGNHPTASSLGVGSHAGNGGRNRKSDRGGGSSASAQSDQIRGAVVRDRRSDAGDSGRSDSVLSESRETGFQQGGGETEMGVVEGVGGGSLVAEECGNRPPLYRMPHNPLQLRQQQGRIHHHHHNNNNNSSSSNNSTEAACSSSTSSSSSSSSSSHASAALLQHLALSASGSGSAAGSCQQRQVADLNPGSVLLPQTATPDVEAASHILMSAMQQHQHHSQQQQHQHHSQQQPPHQHHHHHSQQQHHSQLQHESRLQQQQQYYSQPAPPQQQQQPHPSHHHQQHPSNPPQHPCGQHSAAVVIAADSLASLSYGATGQQQQHQQQEQLLLPRQPDPEVPADGRRQRVSGSSSGTVGQPPLPLPPHPHHSQQQQQQPQQSEDYNGLNVFMSLL